MLLILIHQSNQNSLQDKIQIEGTGVINEGMGEWGKYVGILESWYID
jgi:hypothetical protein